MKITTLRRTTALALSLFFAFAFACAHSQVEEATEPGLYADMVTSKGSITIQLFYDKTPMTVMNFMGLGQGSFPSNQEAGKPYYDGLKFHRVIPKFMIQGGDPQGNGRGGPGYKFPDEFDPSLKHDKAGILSMANAGPGTNGSQFFITHNATPWLNGKHTVFGQVVSGQSVVDAIRQGDTIETLTFRAVGAEAEAFQPDHEKFKEWVQQTKKGSIYR